MVQIPNEAWNDLLDYLLAHEDDIYYGVNDLGKLSYVFASVVGRLPMEMRQDQRDAASQLSSTKE